MADISHGFESLRISPVEIKADSCIEECVVIGHKTGDIPPGPRGKQGEGGEVVEPTSGLLAIVERTDCSVVSTTSIWARLHISC